MRVGSDIPDMVGVDRDNNVVIVENKNGVVDEEILPQILRYAIWAETHPDSIKAMWLEAQERPDDIEIEWDRLKIRLIVLAPVIKLSVPRLVKKIGYRVELIELKKFFVGPNEFILVNRLEEPDEETTRGAKGLEIYDKAFYRDHRNPRSVEAFFDLKKELEKIVKAKRWNLEAKFNAYYVGFKSGFFNVFGIHWIGNESLEVFVKLPKTRFAELKRLCPYQIEYDERWKQATIRVADGLKSKKLIPVLERAYELFMGRRSE